MPVFFARFAPPKRRGPKTKAVAWAVFPLLCALALTTLLAGCGSGGGTAPINPPLVGSSSGTNGGGGSTGGSTGGNSGNSGGNVSSTTLLQGNTAVRGAILAGNQSLGAGISYPFMALQLSAPKGSMIGRATKAYSAIAGAKQNAKTLLTSVSRSLSGQKGRAANLAFAPILNLYADLTPNPNGSVTTVTFYKDADGTQPAGTLTLTFPSAAAASTDYPSYPVQIVMTANLTAGNVPCNGSITITYADNSGANTMVGTLHLPQTGIDLDINLTLDDALKIGGSAIVRENGATITISNVSGNLEGDFGGPVTVAPYGWTGKASLNLITGAFSVSVDTGNGTTASASQAGTGSPLQISYPDKTAEQVLQPLTAALTTAASGGTGSTGGGGSGPTNDSVYQTPRAISDYAGISAINENGSLIGSQGLAQFYPAPALEPQYLSLLPGKTQSLTFGFNKRNQIVGECSTPDSHSSVGVYWDNPNAVPVALKIPAGYQSVSPSAINDKGEIVGVAEDTMSSAPPPPGAVYWARYDADPVLLTPPGEKGCQATGINNNSVIIGSATFDYLSSNGVAVAWTSPSANPVAFPGFGGSTTGYTSANAINDSNEVVGTDTSLASRGILWTITSGVVGAPVALPLLPGDATTQPFGINNAGQIAGDSVSSAYTYHAALWNRAASVQALQDLIPSDSGWRLDRAFKIGGNGVIYGKGRVTQNNNGGTDVQYIIYPR